MSDESRSLPVQRASIGIRPCDPAPLDGTDEYDDAERLRAIEESMGQATVSVIDEDEEC